MTNTLGKNESLELFNRAGIIVYKYVKYLNDYSFEYTYNDNGNILTFRNSNDYSSECTYDKKGNQLTYKNSNDYSSERTFDENDKELAYKDSDGETRSFNTPEYTMEELTKMLGKNFKIKK